MKDRYFIVNYVASSPEGHCTGRVDISRNDGDYLNRKDTKDEIRKKTPDLTNIVITNVTELSRKDFESWTKVE